MTKTNAQRTVEAAEANVQFQQAFEDGRALVGTTDGFQADDDAWTAAIENDSDDKRIVIIGYTAIADDLVFLDLLEDPTALPDGNQTDPVNPNRAAADAVPDEFTIYWEDTGPLSGTRLASLAMSQDGFPVETLFSVEPHSSLAVTSEALGGFLAPDTIQGVFSITAYWEDVE